MTGWFIDGDLLCNPQGKAVADIRKGLSGIERAELRDFIEDSIRRAVSQAHYDWEHEHDPPTEDPD